MNEIAPVPKDGLSKLITKRCLSSPADFSGDHPAAFCLLLDAFFAASGEKAKSKDGSRVYLYGHGHYSDKLDCQELHPSRSGHRHIAPAGPGLIEKSKDLREPEKSGSYIHSPAGSFSERSSLNAFWSIFEREML